MLIAATALALAVCAFIYWQRKQKEENTSRQFAELSASRNHQGSTPAQQKAILEQLRGSRGTSETGRQENGGHVPEERATTVPMPSQGDGEPRPSRLLRDGQERK